MYNNRYEKEDLDEALRVLRAGGVILYPTDTVWGIGCDATNAEAVKRVYEIKRRAEQKSMLVLMEGAGKLQGYVREVPEVAWQLLEVTGEDGQKPLTIVYPDAKNLAQNLVAEDGSIGIRITNEPFTKALCTGLKHPLVSTSANISGEPAAKTYRQISKDVLEAVDYVCRYRRDDEEEKLPSSIIKVNKDNSIEIIRK
ncbi:MAG: threonylcarbamoyl-AMP synthase [Paludibacteraceae bacterium]|nr:threonylcarbamoyl-AMP synthase [Paludibacteraceae bacterium]